ncbi:MAG: NAD(P)-dependent oxidoreductase [Myxococcales bacterium]|nr:NAD(P)-dependent oxidoreductase [Myxococcales bacterium]
MVNKLAFVGLGVMGYPMAGWLQRAGCEVAVYNRTRSRAEAWVAEYGGTSASTPAEAAAGAAAVLVCVGRDSDVWEVTCGPSGALAAMDEGAVLIDHTTASADLARRLGHACARAGVEFVDAPVSGGELGAKGGKLTAMCGSSVHGFALAKPIIAHYAQCVRLLGPIGSGQLAKMANQICIAGLLQGLSEGLHFCQMAGLDPFEVVQVISQGAAQSWQMDKHHRRMVDGEFEHGFAVDWMRKDLSLALAEARKNGSQLPVTALVDQFYADVQGLGGGRWDTSSLIARLQALASPMRSS